MGKAHKYRWEKRREKTKRRTLRLSFDLFTFQVILLIVIFFIWLVGARFIQIYALTQLPCVEAVAQFGASQTTESIFEILYRTSLLGGLLWLVLTFAFRKEFNRTSAKLFHAALLGCVVLITSNFRHIILPAVDAPDGFISTHDMIASEIEGRMRYNPVVHETYEFGSWQMTALNPEGQLKINKPGYEFQNRCVWLKENRIADSIPMRNDEYGLMSNSERIEFVHQLPKFRPRQEWIKPTLKSEMNNLVTLLFSRTTGIEKLKAIQIYRPISDEERTRFIEKTACHSAHMRGAPFGRNCTYRWVTDWDAYNRDWDMRNSHE